MKRLGTLVLPLFLVLLSSNLSDAQDFIVTTTGDTLTGETKPMFYGVDKKVQLKTADKKKTVYPMFKVMAFRYREEIYQPVKGPDGYTFMKLIKPGYLSLYNYQLPNQATFDGQYVTRKDGTGMEVPNLSFKKFMKSYLEDCPAVVEKIDNGDLGKKELLQIIDEYNQCMETKTVNHEKLIAEAKVQNKIIGAWDILENKVKEEPDFEGKGSALEMIQEIKSKISSGDKIPNFVLDGLRNVLKQDTFKEVLENAMAEIK